MPKYNPFRPNSIVNIGMFAGRWAQMEAFEQSLFQTKHGNPRHFLIQGERGIGKSSLLFAVELNADGQLEVSKGTKFNFISLQLELVANTSYEDIVSKVAAAFTAEVRRRQQIKQFASAAWDFVSNWKILGVEYKKDGTSSEILLVDSLCDGIATFLNSAGNDLDGIVILIDEADKPSPDARLGEFVKLFSERMTKLRCDRVCLGLAGLPTLTAKLRESHESAPRIFEAIQLDPLSVRDSERVVRRGLADATAKNGFETVIEQEALEAIIRLSEGYPHFIQQFCYSAFDQDNDNLISVSDVNEGAFKPNGALDQLGRRYFAELYFDKISSEDYRRVLNSMADNLDGWISRAEIIKASGVKNTQVTNALKALKDRGIILLNPEKPGEYRLPTRSFAVWIKALTAKKAAAA